MGLATLLPWTTRLSYGFAPASQGGRLTVLFHHSLGIVTMPAGPLTAALAVPCAVLAWRWASGRLAPGWWSLLAVLGALGVLVTETTQLILGRRNWLDRDWLHHNVGPYARAVGPGVWVALSAGVLVFAANCTYNWMVLSERRHLATPTPGRGTA